MNPTDKQWSPINTLAIKRITSLDVSPDGKRLAFTVMQAVMTAEPGIEHFLERFQGKQEMPGMLG